MNRACTAVDAVAYRPAVVRLTRRLPVWWHCQLAHASMALDDRWGTGYWESDSAPPVPEGLCEACGRRAAWLTVGGTHDEDDEEDGNGDFLDDHLVNLCGWCQLDLSRRPRNRTELDAILAEAGERSIGWRWRWRPMP
jgi:hypothetical protein